MSQPLLPAPLPNDDERRRANAEHSQADARAQRSQGPRRHVVSEADCLAALSSLPGLVVVGILSPAQANTIRGVYAAILQHYQRQSPYDRGGVADDALVDMLRRHPDYANLLEPLLSAEQIAAIFARGREGSHGTA